MNSVVISVLRPFIARVQTFNNEIECNQAKDIENVPQRCTSDVQELVKMKERKLVEEMRWTDKKRGR